jgi:hypothetical protein
MAESRLTNERGAMLIQVAICILVLMGFLVFVVDNGLLWVARGQAQNAADAGALAGAVARAYDDPSAPPPAGGVVEVAATSTVANNLVWKQAGTAAVTYNCPADVLGGGCVRVDVFRNGENASPTLPVVFGRLLGISSQGVKATATAQAAPASAAQCLKPWAVADKWLEAGGAAWTQQSIYEPAKGDSYVPPYGGNGTGFSAKDANGDPVDWGMQLTLKLAHSGPAGSPGTLSSGWSMEIDLPNDSNPQYANNITGCTTAIVGIATQANQCTAPDPPNGCLDVLTGAKVGQTNPGVDYIVKLDKDAVWDPSLRNGQGGVRSAFNPSPRIVPVAVFDTALYVSGGYNGTNGVVKVVNFLGFFIEGLCKDSFTQEPYLDCSNNNNDVVGRLVTFPGTMAVASPNPGPASFGVVIRLVR